MPKPEMQILKESWSIKNCYPSKPKVEKPEHMTTSKIYEDYDFPILSIFYMIILAAIVIFLAYHI